MKLFDNGKDLIAKFDACSLIWAIKVDIFKTIQSIYQKIIITKEIEMEAVSEGLKRGYPDAKIIQEKIENKEILIIPCEKRLFENLGDGELEVISETHIEREKGINAIFITQDVKAKKLAMKNNIPAQGIEICLLEAALKKIISKEEFLIKLYKIGNEFLVPNERIIEIEIFFKKKGG